MKLVNKIKIQQTINKAKNEYKKAAAKFYPALKEYATSRKTARDFNKVKAIERDRKRAKTVMMNARKKLAAQKIQNAFKKYLNKKHPVARIVLKGGWTGLRPRIVQIKSNMENGITFEPFKNGNIGYEVNLGHGRKSYYNKNSFEKWYKNPLLNTEPRGSFRPTHLNVPYGRNVSTRQIVTKRHVHPVLFVNKNSKNSNTNRRIAFLRKHRPL